MPKITEVKDSDIHVLPSKIDQSSLDSAKRGHEGIGMNEKTYNEKMAENNQAVDVTEE